MRTLFSVCQRTLTRSHHNIHPSNSLSCTFLWEWTFPKNRNNPDTQSFEFTLLLIKFIVELRPWERRTTTLTTLLFGLHCDFDRIAHIIVVNLKWTRLEGLKRSVSFYLSDSWLTELQSCWGFATQALLVCCLSCKPTVDVMVMSSAHTSSSQGPHTLELKIHIFLIE